MATDLLDACYQVLTAAKGPVHWHELHKGCLLLGASPDDSRASVNKVWTSIDRDIKASGDASRFRYLGRNVFVAREFFNPTDVREKKAYTARAATDPYAKPKPPMTPPEEQRCGNCKYLSFSGPGYHQQIGGVCNNQEKSGRWYARSAQESCGFWRQRSEAQIGDDRHQRKLDLIELDKVNRSMRGKVVAK